MITRRKFLKDTTLGLASLAILPFKRRPLLVQFPVADRLGRVNVGMAEVRAKPDAESNTVAKVYEDTVLSWMREVVG